MPGEFADLKAAHDRHGGPWIVKPAALFGGHPSNSTLTRCSLKISIVG
jgi:hypothetical protein